MTLSFRNELAAENLCSCIKKKEKTDRVHFLGSNTLGTYLTIDSYIKIFLDYFLNYLIVVC